MTVLYVCITIISPHCPLLEAINQVFDLNSLVQQHVIQIHFDHDSPVEFSSFKCLLMSNLLEWVTRTADYHRKFFVWNNIKRSK